MAMLLARPRQTGLYPRRSWLLTKGLEACLFCCLDCLCTPDGDPLRYPFAFDGVHAGFSFVKNN